MQRFILAIVSVFIFSGCLEVNANTDDRQQAQTERMVAQADKMVGQPGITNFNERKNAKRILEMRDQKLATFTYIVALDGSLHFMCQSVGYGLPYSTQFVNPERELTGYQSITTIPQPEPNGLFMPTSSDATWITCLDEQGKELAPVYTEPKILVSPFKFRNIASSYQ